MASIPSECEWYSKDWTNILEKIDTNINQTYVQKKNSSRHRSFLVFPFRICWWDFPPMAPIFQQPPATPGIQGTIPPSANHRSHHRLWDRKIQWHGRRPHSHPSPFVVLKRIGQNTIYIIYIHIYIYISCRCCFNFGKKLLNVSGLKKLKHP